MLNRQNHCTGMSRVSHHVGKWIHLRDKTTAKKMLTASRMTIKINPAMYVAFEVTFIGKL